MKDVIIAGVKGWHAALLALPMWIAPPARAADDWNSAARDLARKTATAVGRDMVSISWRNLSSLGAPASAQARAAFEAALRDSGARPGDGAAQAQLTISENPSSYLLVEELRRGDDRQVWIASWPRSVALPAGPAAALDKHLLWEQDEPILDIAPVGDAFLILTPTALLRTAPRQSAPLSWAKSWPRDLRGRLHVNGSSVHAALPGVACSGALEPLSVSCRASDEPWTLDSGARDLLLANFAASRNYFDGRVVTQAGIARTVPPFYSAAALDGLWILALVDGRAQFFTTALEPAGLAGTWGSDLAGTDTRCEGATVALASRPGDGPDAVQAIAILKGAAVAIGQPLEMPGPITALWPPATAIVRNGSKYQAYAIKVSCAQ